MERLLNSNWTRRKHYAFSGMVMIAVTSVIMGVNIALIVRQM